MGIYIDPSDRSKEAWLAQFGVKASQEEILALDFSGPILPVCLVVNPGFSAAAIGYSKEEMERFMFYPGDPRPKTWFLVSKEHLKQFME